MSEPVYKMQPAGHDAPAPKRKYPEPDRRLAQTFETWLSRMSPLWVPIAQLRYELLDQHYEAAVNLTANLQVSQAEAHSLLIKYQEHRLIECAGVFISAIYNKLPDKEIVFDLILEKSPKYLGHRLALGKSLINRGKLDEKAGHKSSSPVVNYGVVADNFGDSANAPVLNYGHCGDFMGSFALAAINFGECGRNMGDVTLNLVNLGECGVYSGHANGPALNFSKAGRKSLFRVNWSDEENELKWGEDFVAALHPHRKSDSVRPHEKFDCLLLDSRILRRSDVERLPELREYLDWLKAQFEKGRTDYKLAIKALEEVNTCDKIQKNIEEILQRANYV